MASLQCVACPRRSTQTRCLPSTEERRREWLLRLNLLEEEFQELERKCALYQQENKRARLCHAHFHNSRLDDYPIDRRILGERPPTLFEQDHDQEQPSTSTRTDISQLGTRSVVPAVHRMNVTSFDAGSIRSPLNSARYLVSLTDRERAQFDPTAPFVTSLSVRERKERARRDAEKKARLMAALASTSVDVKPELDSPTFAHHLVDLTGEKPDSPSTKARNAYAATVRREHKPTSNHSNLDSVSVFAPQPLPSPHKTLLEETREIVPEPIPRDPYNSSRDAGSAHSKTAVAHSNTHSNPSNIPIVDHNKEVMTPSETAEWIEECKKLVDDISDDIAMSTVFTASFDLLKDLCTKEINTQNFAHDLEQMEVHRNLTKKYDRKADDSSEPLRQPIYALSESLQRTAQVLMTKNLRTHTFPTDHQFVGTSQAMAEGFFYPAPKNKPGGGRKKAANEGGQVFHCPICPKISASGRVERTLRNVQAHLRSKHNKTAASASLNIVCACGYGGQNFEKMIAHGRKCKVFHVSMFRLVDEVNHPTPFAPLKCFRELPPIPARNSPSASSAQEVAEQFVCPFCRSTVQRSLNNLQHHLVTHHKRTIKQAGLCLVCACNYTTNTSSDAVQHRKTCEIGSFTIHHAGQLHQQR